MSVAMRIVLLCLCHRDILLSLSRIAYSAAWATLPHKEPDLFGNITEYGKCDQGASSGSSSAFAETERADAGVRRLSQVSSQTRRRTQPQPSRVKMLNCSLRMATASSVPTTG